MIESDKYEALAEKLNESANILWNSVTFINPAEIFDGEVNLSDLDKKCWELLEIGSKASRDLSNKINSIPEDEYFEKWEDIHMKLENLFYSVDDKLRAIDSIISGFKRISEDVGEVYSKFKDSSTINIK